MKTFFKLFTSACLIIILQINSFAQPTDYADYFPLNGSLTSAVYGSKSFNSTGITFTTDKDGNANSACAFTSQSAMNVYGIDQSSNGWTISFLIKITDASGGCILYSSASGYYQSLLHYNGSNSTLVWDGISGTEFTTPVVLNPWYNVVIVNSGDNSANFYINGTLFGTSNYVGSGYLLRSSIYFGKNNSIPSFGGVLDEVRFYNRPLTSTEIAQFSDPNSASTSVWQQSNGGGVYYSGRVGIGTATPLTQLHLASDADHAFEISRANGTYGFRIFRNAQQGNVSFQIGTAASTWETKIKIGEGEGTNTKLLLNPDGGSVGIGINAPQANLHLQSAGSTWLAIDKPNSTFENGIQFRDAGNIKFYFYSDNADNGALKIQANGLTGEADATPRIMIPSDNKNINLALSGGNVLIGKTSQTNSAYKLDVNGNLKVDGMIASKTQFSIGNEDGSSLGFFVNGGYLKFTNNGKTTGYIGQDVSNSAFVIVGGTTYQDAMIFKSGSVGIGATALSEKLEVAGNVKATKFIGDGSQLTGIATSQWSTVSSGISYNGNVIIGQPAQLLSKYILNVGGSVRANEVIVNTDGADFVFDSNYKLRSLNEVERYINQNKHLPEIASAKEMQTNGVGLADFQTKLLQKVEELTLYIIEQNKRIELQNKQLLDQNEKIEKLEKKVEQSSSSSK